MPAVTLDLWHTLVYLPPDEEETYMRGQIELATEVLRRSPPVPGAPERPVAELRAAFERAYQEAVDASAEGRTVTPADQLRLAAERTGRAADPADYVAGLRNVVKGIRFRRAPGVREFLDGLRADGYRVAVISNTVGEPGAYLRGPLRELGIESRVEELFFSDEHPWTKPAPELFRLSLEFLTTPASDAVHVGDGWADLEGARRTGYRTGILFTGLHAYGERYKELFLAHGWDQPPADHRAERLEQVGEIVRTVLPPARA